MELVTAADVDEAAGVLDGVVDLTPLQGSRALAAHVGQQVLLKCENLQRTGSFKLRGAYHRIHRLDDEQRARGVVCASAGNHAQGVALGASMQGVDATVFMPEQAPLPKVEATRGYGATVVAEGNSFDEVLERAMAFTEEQGRVFVHPFDHPDIIAGQGTLGRELLDQDARFTTVVVPIGGGGLVSGVAVAIKAARPDVRIVGVQAAGCAPVAPSLAAGEPVPAPSVDTIADGIAVKQPGRLTLAHIDALVDDVVTVDDQAIARALTLLLERAKLVCEPSGAVGVAALIEGLVEVDGPVVAILSGGNIDPMMLDHLVRSGLAEEGRHVTLHTRIADRPGALAAFLEVLAELRANVVGVEHQRFGRRLRIGQVDVVVELEARGEPHIEELVSQLRERGHVVTRV
ncbi:threonine ammonia-lyase [Salsipaludibacter albus]|uniref:threonine ammonia-lyase n=1 Tax=Salsipaludibacter albus TaxID=2849650 RepID=UPI001EE3F9B6